MHGVIGRFDILRTSKNPALREVSRLWTKPFLDVNPFRYRKVEEGLFLVPSEPETRAAGTSKGSESTPVGPPPRSSRRPR
jgi:hypothetical protein